MHLQKLLSTTSTIKETIAQVNIGTGIYSDLIRRISAKIHVLINILGFLLTKKLTTKYPNKPLNQTQFFVPYRCICLSEQRLLHHCSSWMKVLATLCIFERTWNLVFYQKSLWWSQSWTHILWLTTNLMPFQSVALLKDVLALLWPFPSKVDSHGTLHNRVVFVLVSDRCPKKNSLFSFIGKW